MILLFLLPFYDRGPERRPARRPIATAAGIFTIVAIGYLTFLGANAGSSTRIEKDAPAPVVAPGEEAAATFEAGQTRRPAARGLTSHKTEADGQGSDSR